MAERREPPGRRPLTSDCHLSVGESCRAPNSLIKGCRSQQGNGGQMLAAAFTKPNLEAKTLGLRALPPTASALEGCTAMERNLKPLSPEDGASTSDLD